MPQPDIVCMGESLLEFSEHECEGQTVYVSGFGGDTSNCAIAAARQGANVGYFTALGQDSFADRFLQLWEQEGVDHGAVARRTDGHTGLYFISYGPDGHTFTYMRAGSAASRMGPDDVPTDYIAGARVLHVSGISQAISDSACDAVFAAMEIARANGVAVAYDTNHRPQLWGRERARAITDASVAMADFALPSLEDARTLTGLHDPEAIAKRYRDLGAPVVVLKMGGDGVLLATTEAIEPIAPMRVTPVDATGAGDTFDGAFLARIAAGDSPRDAVVYAGVAAALSTQGVGAVAPMPTANTVRAALASMG